MESVDKMEPLKSIEKEFSDIYYEIMGYDEISVYKELLLTSKANLIALKYKIVVDKLIDEDTEIKRQLKKKKYTTVVAALIELACAFISPVAFILAVIVKWYFLMGTNKLEKQVISKKEWDLIRNKAEEIGNIVNNISTFLESKSNKRIERLQKERGQNIEETLKINIANTWLETFFKFDFEEFSVNLPKDIEIILIKILQDDLKTEEDNLEELLKIARGNISMTIDEEMKLQRTKD